MNRFRGGKSAWKYTCDRGLVQAISRRTRLFVDQCRHCRVNTRKARTDGEGPLGQFQEGFFGDVIGGHGWSTGSMIALVEESIESIRVGIKLQIK